MVLACGGPADKTIWNPKRNTGGHTMGNTVMLFPEVVHTGKPAKSRKASARPGYKDERGQVYLPPVSEKKASHWRIKMAEKGFSFPE